MKKIILLVVVVILLASNGQPARITTVTTPLRGLASGVGYMQQLNAIWGYNWGVWANTECRPEFVPLIPSYYTYLDKDTWERKIKSRSECVSGGYWLVGNEPNKYSKDSDGGYQPDFDLLMDSYNWAIGTIYKYDPNARIIVGGFVGADVNYAARMKQALEYPVTGWHFHLYNYPDIDGFKRSVDWFTNWSDGETWLTEWGVLVGTGQLDWMEQTLPVVQSSNLTRYAWFKTTPWGDVPLNLVDKDGNLTQLGKTYKGQSVSHSPIQSIIEAESNHGSALVKGDSNASSCKYVEFSGGSTAYRIDGTGKHILYFRVKGKDWGSDSLYVTVNGQKLVFDFGHEWAWTPLHGRDIWTTQKFTLPATIKVETRENGAMLDAISVDGKPTIHLCAEPVAGSTPTTTVVPTPIVIIEPTLPPQEFTIEQRLKAAEDKIAELEAKQAQLWEIVTGSPLN